MLGHYRIVAKLGEGGMGVVWKATDTRLDRAVAIKLLPAASQCDADSLARLESEAKTIAALNHPNIVTVYSVEEVDGVRFLTMELVEGESLDDAIPADGLPVERFLALAIPLADAVGTAHERGITHRDLKPGNILVSKKRSAPKVLDFGLARLQQPEAGGEVADLSTRTTERIADMSGTIAYMSPEQLEGRPTDWRSDIFSLGVILYEMATGRHPFPGGTVALVTSAILRDTPEPVDEVNRDYPRSLARTLARCLEKDPRRRFQSALELRRRLEEIDAGVAHEDGEERIVAVLPFADMSPDKDQDYFCEGMAEEIINALSKVCGLRVVARGSTFQFKSSAVDSRTIGRKLGATALVEGGVRKAGNRLRITAQLVNVADGYQLWSERYDRELQDVFAVQEEIAHAVANALQLTLTPTECQTIQSAQPGDVRAYDFYLRGRKFFYRLTKRDFDFARKMFRQAIEIDPEYALAWAGLADCWSFQCLWWASEPWLIEEAERASRRAVELGPNLAEAHASRGIALTLGDDWEQTEQEFLTAIRLNPELYEGHYFYARASFAAGKLEQAARLFEQAAQLRPEDYQCPLLLRQVYLALGREADARRVTEEGLMRVRHWVECHPDDTRALYLGANALVVTGHREEGLQWMEQALSFGPDEPGVLYNGACVMVKVGDHDRAFELLTRVVESGFGHKAWIEHDSDLEPLRSDPRYPALMKRLK